jgi:hypothetical protein
MKNVFCFKVFGEVPLDLRYKYSPNPQVIFVNAMIVKTPIIALDFSNVWLERVEQLQLTYTGLKDNVSGYFTPAPSNPTLPNLLIAITDFSDAQFAVDSNVAGAVPLRDAKWKAVKKMAIRIRNYVFDIADDKPDHAAEIAQEANMVYFVREGRENQKPGAKSEAPGEVEILGSTRKTRVCTDYQICKDPKDEKNWLLIKVFPTSAAHTKVVGLEWDVDYFTRSCIITKDGPEPWEPVIPVRTKKDNL